MECIRTHHRIELVVGERPGFERARLDTDVRESCEVLSGASSKVRAQLYRREGDAVLRQRDTQLARTATDLENRASLA